jgi:hypothetical protein
MEESTETTTKVLLVEKEPLTCTKHLLLNFHIIFEKSIITAYLFLYIGSLLLTCISPNILDQLKLAFVIFDYGY